MPRSSALRSAFALFVILVSSLPAAAVAWRSYANPRFGFSVEIPAPFRDGTPPENGDGLDFTSPDGAVTLAAYGHFLARPGDMRADALDAEAFEKKDGLAVTYRAIAADHYALSGIIRGRIVYLRAVSTCGGDASATVRIVYSIALKASLDPLVTHMAASLRGSTRC